MCAGPGNVTIMTILSLEMVKIAQNLILIVVCLVPTSWML